MAILYDFIFSFMASSSTFWGNDRKLCLWFFFCAKMQGKTERNIKICAGWDKTASQELVIFVDFFHMFFFIVALNRNNIYWNQAKPNEIGLTWFLKSKMANRYRPIPNRIFGFGIGFRYIPTHPVLCPPLVLLVLRLFQTLQWLYIWSSGISIGGG